MKKGLFKFDVFVHTTAFIIAALERHDIQQRDTPKNNET